MMAKVVTKSLNGGRFGKTARAVGKKHVVTATGRRTVLTLDAHDGNFDDGLTYVFTRNVAKARRENKRITGSADVAPRKR
jgi:hypothetical protein